MQGAAAGIVEANGIRLAYEASGPEHGAPLLLIHGVGAQLVRWPTALLRGLEAAGFRVIRFDNRDVGLSTHFREAGVPDLAAATAAKARGERPALPYHLEDLAADTLGLLDALGIGSAHLLGVSLGGMIAQALAIAQPARVRSLALVMTQSGNPALPPPSPAGLAALTQPAPDPAIDREAYLRHSVALNRTLGSPAYPTDEGSLRAFAAAAADRAHDPAGAARQLAAGRASADRRAALTRLHIPTLVIHGADDPLIDCAAGKDLARHIQEAWLLIVQGMGHDLPDQLCDLFVATIRANCTRAPASPPDA